MVSNSERENGKFYTTANPFRHQKFLDWAVLADIEKNVILEPFAGANNIIRHLQDIFDNIGYHSFDKEPGAPEVTKSDTIYSFPRGYEVCVTNPPWLAKNSATKRGLSYPKCNHDNLYKHCLELAIKRCPYVAMILPASYMSNNMSKDRLYAFILLPQGTFDDTKHPAALALFVPNMKKLTCHLYNGDNWIGNLPYIESLAPNSEKDYGVKFNDKKGEVGLVCFDSTKGRTIHFCDPEEIPIEEVKASGRCFTRISYRGSNEIKRYVDLDDTLNLLNSKIEEYRNATGDIMLCPFNGYRTDGVMRRRLDFALARKIINNFCENKIK